MVVIRVIGIQWYQVYNVAEGHCLNPIAQLHEGWTRTIWTDTDWRLDTLGWWFQITMSSNTVIASGLRSASNNESLNLRPTPFLWCLRVELPHSFSFFRGKTWWQSIGVWNVPWNSHHPRDFWSWVSRLQWLAEREKAGTTPALACSAAAPATVLSHLPSPNDHHPYPLKQRRVVQIYPMPQPAISNGFSNGSSNMVDSWAPTLEPCCAGHGN